MSRKLNIGVVQLSSEVCEAGENLEKAIAYLELLAERDVDVVVLPEMFNTGYGSDPAILEAAENAYEETVETLCALADDQEILIVAGIARRNRFTWYNSTVVLRPFLEPIFYDKTHLFRSEKTVFTPGESFLTFDYLETCFGVLMCFEIGFPEISRKLCSQGVEILLAPFAFGKERRRIYETATCARAIENGAFLVAASQSGKPATVEFVGSSRIIHPSGRVLCDAGDSEGIISFQVNVDDVERYRYHEGGDSNGYLSNLRPELYLK